MTAKEYFDSHVLEVVEIEYEDGGRFWTEPMTSDEADAYIRRNCKSDVYPDSNMYFSDRDFCTKQKDKFVQRVLELAKLNWFKNDAWCKRNNLTSYWKVIDFILENELYKAS